MTRRLYYLSRWCAEHAVVVILAWIAILLVLSGLNNRLPPPGQQEFVLEGTDSAAAQTLLNRAFPGASSDAQPLVVACDVPLDSGRGERLLKNEEAALEKVNGVVSVTGPAQQEALLSPDKQTAILNVQVNSSVFGEPAAAQAILDTGKEQAPGCQVALGGLMGQVLSDVNTRTSEGIGILAAVVVLLFTLRRFAAAFVPLLNAIMAVGIGSAIVGLLGRLTFIPDVAPTLGTMLGLGVGIDYALFLVMRHRSLLRKGFEVNDSVGRTAGTAGAGMVFAGTTLILAVTGLALTQIAFLAWLGYAAAAFVAVAILASLTLVPAVFGLMKMRVLPKRDTKAHHITDEHLDVGIWARIADAVADRPWRFAIGATLVLVIMALPMTRMEFGQTDASALPPETTAYQANALTVEAFGPGFTGPLAVVLQMNRAAAAPEEVDVPSGTDPRTLDPRLTDVEEVLADTPGIQEVGNAIVSPDGGVAVIRVIPTTGPTDPATETLVEHLRDDVLPPATNGQEEEAHVGGSTALMMDLTDQIGQSLPRFIAGVVLLSAFLLMLAYRSIVIPVKAALMNLLSISAAYGVVVAIFQFGWGASLIGVDELVPIQSYVPMMMFAVLFGLSMDYEVFLLTSFQEHWTRSRDMVTSVRRGLTDTGQVVTSAAAIMVVVFASFILIPTPIVKMFGVGLATAVLVDATIVRCLLVPALMVLAAKWTWWLPHWLDRALPQLHVEGDPSSLASIHEPRLPDRPRTVKEAITPTTPLLFVLFGVAIAWIIGSRMAPQTSEVPFQDVAIVTAAVVGGIVVWLPRGIPGVGRSSGARIIALLCGSVGVALTYALVRALIPYTQQNPGQMAAWALLGITLVAAFTKARRYGLPMILGGIVMAVTIAVSGAQDAGLGTLMEIAIIPSFLAGLLALVVQRLTYLVREPVSTGSTDGDGGSTDGGDSTDGDGRTTGAIEERELTGAGT